MAYDSHDYKDRSKKMKDFKTLSISLAEDDARKEKQVRKAQWKKFFTELKGKLTASRIYMTYGNKVSEELNVSLKEVQRLIEGITGEIVTVPEVQTNKSDIEEEER